MCVACHQKHVAYHNYFSGLVWFLNCVLILRAEFSPADSFISHLKATVCVENATLILFFIGHCSQCLPQSLNGLYFNLLGYDEKIPWSDNVLSISLYNSISIHY